MKFEEALAAMREGKKVTRDYETTKGYWYMEGKDLFGRYKHKFKPDEFVTINHSADDGMENRVPVSAILAEDWEVVE